ncbi:hypothetical protein IR083_07135 [Dysgonomonas sp. GY75]|uniref:hypothetical protein n=1 Tax=Dysgonomonas sp. GY75 TaxID=2780419 RepID=UPI00188453B4|nr:hypothetical protein [Dysgonomonas sp. GY75]MBF0648588.1 hypothetical protein [Dysgonomonas sp. GY75]
MEKFPMGTVFHYRLGSNIIFATHRRGNIVHGQLTGRVFAEPYLEFAYQHTNTDKE